eukprot:GILK01003472.1.p1 GENE.GILK01003472.1~~GILK01003472.1.p1  ORF type:complete len:1034 (+),score=223.64 GILK01003472.1:50-3151(+)
MADPDELFSVFGGNNEEEEDDNAPPPKRKAATLRDALPSSRAVKKPKIATVAPSSNDTEMKDVSSTKQGEGEVVIAEALADAPTLKLGLPEFVVKRDESEKNCIHEIVYPVDYVAPEWHPPAKAAKEYSFTLDPFQRRAVECLEKNESVLVSAHTSAGKTAVAEYAIAKSLRDNQRVIYTSPIKALSNQKYRELNEEFKDVGLMTGDVTINPNASCIVMTTEILRSMLYRGSEIMREMAWVIFDEIHYMRDKERGVVWEETIILLPNTVRYVFLSATIPNAREFAEWICHVKNQPCHVVYTDYRPVPLQHYIFPAGGDGLFLVVDDKGVFREDNFQKALAALTAAVDPANQPSDKKKKAKPMGGGSDVYKIVKMIMERSYQPVIVFSFSKRECEGHALAMAKLDFNSEEEKTMVEAVYSNALATLSDDDKALPQVEHILPLLKRGIGIHHGGLLPIIKEVIEILFQEGLVKALFSTETFSMGLNMPAKTVVFTSVRKFDGENFRWIGGGEYIQMSGRAGRRGLDDRGITILMVDEKMEPSVAKGMLKGHSDPLNSTFHLGYNMLLNLLRVEDADPEYMIRRSFHQFQNDRQFPEMERKLNALEAERDSIEIPDEQTVAEYYMIKSQIERAREEMRAMMNQAEFVLPFLQPGRLARVQEGDLDFGWGVVINFQKRNAEKMRTEKETVTYIVDVALNCAPPAANDSKPKPCPPDQAGEIQIVPIKLELLNGLSSVRIYIPKDLRSVDSRASIGRSLREIRKRFPDGIPLLDPIKDMQIDNADFEKLIKKVESLEERLIANPLFNSSELKARYKLYHRKTELEDSMKVLRQQMKANQTLVLKDDLKAMKRVLRRLGFVNKENIIQVKGRIACEISTSDELLITELMFNGVFNEMKSDEIVSLLSALVFQEKSEDTVRFREELEGPFRALQETARRIAKVSQESKLGLDMDEYVNSFKPQLMELTYMWCQGAKFSEVCKMTDVFEGTIIRALRRLDELLRQLASAAKSIGNTELEQKFAEGIAKIKRGIVFAASLYL